MIKCHMHAILYHIIQLGPAITISTYANLLFFKLYIQSEDEMRKKITEKESLIEVLRMKLDDAFKVYEYMSYIYS